MKKILAVLVFVLLAACLIAPKFIAPKYQEQLSQLVTNLNSAPGYGARLDTLEEGWFISKSVLHLSYDLSMIDPNLYGQKLEADLVLDAHFGPLLLSDTGVVGLFDVHAYYAGDSLRDRLNWPEGQAFFDASVIMDLMGNIESVDQIPAFDINEGEFTFSGYKGEGTFTSNSIAYQGQIEQLNLDKYDDKMQLANTQLALNIQNGADVLASGGFYNGDISIGFDQFSLGSQNTPTELEVNGASLLVTSLLDTDSQLGEIVSRYAVDNVRSDEFSADELALVVEMTNLSNQFFLDYKTFSDAVLADGNVSPDELTIALFTFITDNIDELLSHQPELNMTEFSGRLAEGSFHATLNSRLKDINGSVSLDQLLDQNFWLWNLIVNSNIQADDALVTHLGERYLAQQMRTTVDSPQVKQQVQMLLNNFVQQGFIKRENDQLMTEIKIANGQGKIYDFPFPLAR
ncbi:YdgA family protein [Marinomonas posidonica]|uniref:YdgA family protein n=1 Tax=Marinomonas posidonica TaxID=936476 RepID=UPI0037362216